MKASATVISGSLPCTRAHSPETELALLHSVLLVSVEAQGHCWSKTEDLLRVHAHQCVRNLLLFFAHGHSHSPELTEEQVSFSGGLPPTAAHHRGTTRPVQMSCTLFS